MPASFSVALSNTCCNWIAISGIPAWGGFGVPLPWLAAPSGGTCQMLAKVSGGRGPGLQKQAGVSKLETARSCTVGLILLTLASRVKLRVSRNRNWGHRNKEIYAFVTVTS